MRELGPELHSKPALPSFLFAYNAVEPPESEQVAAGVAFAASFNVVIGRRLARQPYSPSPNLKLHLPWRSPNEEWDIALSSSPAISDRSGNLPQASTIIKTVSLQLLIDRYGRDWITYELGFDGTVTQTNRGDTTADRVAQNGWGPGIPAHAAGWSDKKLGEYLDSDEDMLHPIRSRPVGRRVGIQECQELFDFISHPDVVDGRA